MSSPRITSYNVCYTKLLRDYNLQYKGNKSKLVHPKKSSKDNLASFSTGNLSSPKTIVVNAKYSNVTMQ